MDSIEHSEIENKPINKNKLKDYNSKINTNSKPKKELVNTIQNENEVLKGEYESTKNNIIQFSKYQLLIENLKITLNDLQESKDKNTSLTNRGIDSIVGLFGGETGAEIYEENLDNLKEQILKLYIKFLRETKGINLSEAEQKKYDFLEKQFENLLNYDLENTSIKNLILNDFKDIDERLILAAYYFKGGVTSIYEGAINIIKSPIDLLKFMGKFTFSGEYRREIQSQANIIWNFCKDSGFVGIKDTVLEVLGQEMSRIGSLPANKQAEEIGKIAGNVIFILATIKGGQVISKKASKIGIINNSAQKINKISKIKNLSVRGADILINGVSDKILKKALKVSYKEISLLLKNNEGIQNAIQKLKENLEKIIKLNVNSESDNLAKNKYLDLLKKEIRKLNREKYSSLSLKEMGDLNDFERIEAGEAFLDLDLSDSPSKKIAIIEAHNVGESGYHNYSLAEIRKKHKILKDAGFESNEIRILMEKGVCGKEGFKIRGKNKTDLLNMRGSYEISKIKKVKPIEAYKRIEDFASNIDVEYIIDNPERIRDMLDIIESQCYYIISNSDVILKLDGIKLENFRVSFNNLRKKLEELTNNPLLEFKYRKIFDLISERNVKSAFYKLNPNLAPKK